MGVGLEGNGEVAEDDVEVAGVVDAEADDEVPVAVAVLLIHTLPVDALLPSISGLLPSTSTRPTDIDSYLVGHGRPGRGRPTPMATVLVTDL